MADDFTADTTTTGTILISGDGVNGRIETSTDADWFAVRLNAGEAYQFEVSSTEEKKFNPYIYGIWRTDGGSPSILAGTSERLRGSLDKGVSSKVELIAPSDGVYYLEVRAQGGRSHEEQFGAYEIFARISSPFSASFPDDFDDGPLLSGRMVNGSATGEIEYTGDIDWFQVRLEQGRTYQFDATGSGDEVIKGLYAPNELGNRYLPETYDDDGGTGDNARLTYTPTTTGAYYLAVSSNDDIHPQPWIGTHIGYTVNVSDVTPTAPGRPGPRPLSTDDYGQNASSAGRLMLTNNQVTVTGNIEVRHDRDWFRVILDPSKEYQIDLEGLKTDKGTLYDPYLYGIYDVSGNLIPGTTDDDGGHSLNSQLIFTPTADTFYYISVGAWGAAQGTYQLSIEEAM